MTASNFRGGSLFYIGEFGIMIGIDEKEYHV